MHRPLLERTNSGCYFADCTCGWAGGVHKDRATARLAFAHHVEGKPAVPPLVPTFLVGPPAQGQED